ncbi:Golgi-associated plant pathogenesis-related protein 1 [Trichinella pseudospiralis]|uniref:Golgi-associated plant pathogenesis-related protein 1 n=1 Tax=Trichinella pseudospiralis TaxID=6337 RepID=A0A0V1ISS8_TRIPS|nr:Golgi-associated plant pathogenesis-related protein 1 [Trichinella pseudospiralis]
MKIFDSLSLYTDTSGGLILYVGGCAGNSGRIAQVSDGCRQLVALLTTTPDPALGDDGDDDDEMYNLASSWITTNRLTLCKLCLAHPAPSLLGSCRQLSLCSSLFDGQSTKMSRLDEPMEQLDEHLMKHALKEVKYRPGAKFMVFNDIAFQREFLEVHNKVRARHGCPPLSWSQRLADEATAWADKLLAKGRILYRDEQDIGENIVLMTIKRSTRLPTGTEVTEKWASQVEKYDFKNPGWSEGSHNFTQMIWKASTEVGCARRWSASNQQAAVVAFYYPVGNANSTQSFRDNVPPPCQ